MLYLASENIIKKWIQRYRNWDQVLSHFRGIVKTRNHLLHHGSLSYNECRIGIFSRLNIASIIRLVCFLAVSRTSKLKAIYSNISLKSHSAYSVYTIFQLIHRNPYAFYLQPFALLQLYHNSSRLNLSQFQY